MRSLLNSAVLVLTIALPAVAAPKASPTSQARQEIQAACNAGNAAAERHDAVAVMKFSTPDSVIIDLHGVTLSHAKVKSRLQAWMAAVHDLHVTDTVQTLKLQPRGALVTIEEHAQFM